LHLNLLRNTGILCFLILTISCTPIEKSEVSISLKPELTIGIEEGDENYMFGGIATIEEDEEGNIYVLDFKFRTIKKYDKNGKFIEVFDKRDFSYKGSSKIEINGYPEPTQNGNIYFSDEWRITKFKIIIKGMRG